MIYCSDLSQYEDQKEESLKKATDFRQNRLPKFFSYFERVLKHNESSGQNKHLVGNSLTYAEFPLLFDTFYPSLKQEAWLKKYLDSKKRKPYSMGVFRHYPELDRQ